MGLGTRHLITVSKAKMAKLRAAPSAAALARRNAVKRCTTCTVHMQIHIKELIVLGLLKGIFRSYSLLYPSLECPRFFDRSCKVGLMGNWTTYLTFFLNFKH